MSLTPITATLNGKSITNITISDYGDGVISFKGFTLTNPQPIVTVCREILKIVGKDAQPYPLAINRGVKTIFTIRSVIWGSRMTIDPEMPDYVYIDRQMLDNVFL